MHGFSITDYLQKKLKPAVIREARLEGLRKELRNSRKLQTHFDAKPGDLAALQHGASLSNHGKADRHLKHVPAYMVPKAMKHPNSVVGQARRTLGTGVWGMNPRLITMHD